MFIMVGVLAFENISTMKKLFLKIKVILGFSLKSLLYCVSGNVLFSYLYESWY